MIGRLRSTQPSTWGGIVGPLAFIGAWALGGVVTSRSYSAVDDAISRLAAVGSDVRPLMTTGMVVFGSAVVIYAQALRSALPSRSWIAATVTGLATILVAALPLDHSDTVDDLHGLAAGIGYVSLTLVPLLAARPLLADGHRRLGLAGIVLGSISAIALPVSLAADSNGLFQRIGLTASDLWIIASAPVVRKLLSCR